MTSTGAKLRGGSESSFVPRLRGGLAPADGDKTWDPDTAPDGPLHRFVFAGPTDNIDDIKISNRPVATAQTWDEVEEAFAAPLGIDWSNNSVHYNLAIDIYNNRCNNNTHHSRILIHSVDDVQPQAAFKDQLKPLLGHDPMIYHFVARKEGTQPFPTFTVPDSARQAGRVVAPIPPSQPASPNIVPPNPTPPVVKVVPPRRLYSYSGELGLPDLQAAAFLDRVRRLTFQTHTSEYEFEVDFIKSDPAAQKETISVNHTNYNQMFGSEISARVSANPDVTIFVRRQNQAVPTELHLPQGTHDIIRLVLQGVGVAHWKVPQDLTTATDYGVNQIQPGFHAAMSVLLPERPNEPITLRELRPPTNTTPIRDYPLGNGGLEITTGFWAFVTSYRGSRDLQFQVDVDGPAPAATNGFIRLVGHATKEDGIRNNDFVKLEENIKNLVIRNITRERPRPTLYRIWKSAQDWEDNQPARSKAISLISSDSALSDLTSFLQPKFVCPWVRPEFDNFIIEETGNATHTTTWTPSCHINPSLDDFRTFLRTFFHEQDPNLCREFMIKENGSRVSRRFVVTNDTTQEEWRKWVYNWLAGRKLTIRPNVVVQYSKLYFYILELSIIVHF